MNEYITELYPNDDGSLTVITKSNMRVTYAAESMDALRTAVERAQVKRRSEPSPSERGT